LGTHCCDSTWQGGHHIILLTTLLEKYKEVQKAAQSSLALITMVHRKTSVLSPASLPLAFNSSNLNYVELAALMEPAPGAIPFSKPFAGIWS